MDCGVITSKTVLLLLSLAFWVRRRGDRTWGRRGGGCGRWGWVLSECFELHRFSRSFWTQFGISNRVFATFGCGGVRELLPSQVGLRSVWGGKQPRTLVPATFCNSYAFPNRFLDSCSPAVIPERQPPRPAFPPRPGRSGWVMGKAFLRPGRTKETSEV